MRAQLEIVNPVTVIVEGDKINASQAALLDRLKICPFEYKMTIKSFLENGKLFNARVLKITSADILASFTAAANNLTAISLSTGYMIESAAPHLLINAFKNLAGAAIAGGYTFPALEALQNAAKNAPAAGAAADAPAAKKVEEVVEDVEEDVDMGGMFGDEDDY